MKRALAAALLALAAGCTPALVPVAAAIKNRANEERMVWLTTERHTEDGKTVETAQTLGLVEPLRLGTFDFEVREDASFRLVATDRSGEPSRPLHATEPRRPRSGETVEVVVER